MFLEIVGESPTMKMLQYLIEGRHFDYSLTDISQGSGVSWGTLHSVFPKFMKYKIVINTREIGRAKLYKLNQENKQVKILIELYDSIILNNLKNKKEILA